MSAEESRSMCCEVLDVRELTHAYAGRCVLDLPLLKLRRGDCCAVVGPSGCGKTTLLQLVAGLLTPPPGRVHVLGQDLAALDQRRRDRFRGRHVALVPQRLHLLPALSVIDNLLLAQRLARVAVDRAAALAMLERLGVGDCARARPGRLSQGQAQRVAVARALLHRPALILADEPTSALDAANAEATLALLVEQTRASDAALLIVTHDLRVSGQLPLLLTLQAPRSRE